LDIEAGEMVEKELDTLVSRRDIARRETEGERAREELWAESVRRHNARVGETRRLERLAYHEGQARRLSSTLEALIAHHGAEAERYRSNGHHEEESA
jgi:hypothetical protein